MIKLLFALSLSSCAPELKEYGYPHVASERCESMTFPLDDHARCTHRLHDWKLVDRNGKYWVECRCR